MIVKFRSHSEAKDMLKKMKKLERYFKELIECIEEHHGEEDDDDEDYRYDEEERLERERDRDRSRSASYRSRYRRGM